MRYSLKQFTVAGILWTLVAGTLSHYVFEWTGNCFLAGFFFPVNETVWEHLKLIFFPALIFMILESWYLGKEYENLFCKNLVGLYAGLLLMPVLFYGYTFFTGRNYLWADILIFVLCTLTAFLIPYKIRYGRIDSQIKKKCMWSLAFLLLVFFAVSLFFLLNLYK